MSAYFATIERSRTNTDSACYTEAMRQRRLGTSDLVASAPSYGNMRCVGTWLPDQATTERRAAGVRAHIAAFEAGYTLFDTADIYCGGVCEQVLGQTLREVSGMRDNIILATKCGIRFESDPTPNSPHRYDSSIEHIVWSCENSLRHIGVEAIDLYMLHRPDFLMNPAEVSEAFEKLKAAGKVRYVGVSNFTPSFVSALSAHCRFPILVNQVEINLGKLECLTDGTLDQCIEKHVTPLAWSPLGGGWLVADRTPTDEDPRRKTKENILDVLREVGAEHNVTSTVIALAWLMKHPSGIIPIIGSRNPENIRASVRADNVELSREQWYRILRAARGTGLP